MKHLKYLALLSTLALLFPLCASARDKHQHSVDFFNPVKVGSTQLQPGNYKVEWQGAGPSVQVSFLHSGRTVATAPATLRTNDSQATQDDIVTDTTGANALREIDFAHQKEALIFTQRSM
jgi:hypothetical protein